MRHDKMYGFTGQRETRLRWQRVFLRGFGRLMNWWHKLRRKKQTKIAVYTYRTWAPDLSEYSIHERRATREFIQRAGGEIYEKSVKFVDESDVTPEGEEIHPRSN